MKKLLQNKFLNNFCVRMINIIIPIKSVRKKLRGNLYNYRLEGLKNKLAKKYPDYFQFAMFQPWGDFYIPCALFEEFKRKNNNAKILTVCVNKNQEQVLKSIKAIDKVVKIDLLQYKTLFSLKTAEKYVQKLEKGKLYCLSHRLFSEAIDNKSLNFLELYTKMLKLKYPAKLSVPKVVPILKGNYSNTILIYPESKSFTDREISKSFWIDFAEELSFMGYNILFNTKKETYGHFKTIFLPIIKSIQLAKQCKYIIGIRSGFSDILAINKVKNHIVVYPKNIYFKTITKQQQENEFSRAFVMQKNKTFEENMLRITSLKMFNDFTTEIYFTDEKTMKEQIIKHIKGDNNE